MGSTPGGGFSWPDAQQSLRPCQMLNAPNLRPAPAEQETGPPTPLLDTINYPVHLKNLGLNDLKKLCKELRAGAAAAPRWGFELSLLP